MTELAFTFWLQGWVELNGGKMPDAAQWEMIKEHLSLSFTKVTKPLDPPPSTNVHIPRPSPFKIDPKGIEIDPLKYYPAFDPQRFFLDTTIKPGTVMC